MNGQSIFASKEVKYLGVHFTRWGRTNQQVAHNARNASRALNVIKVVSAQPWANTPKMPVNVVRALVRSRLSYGLEAMPHLSKTGLARLTAIEVRGLRLALGLPQSVPQCLVYREAGLLPFRRHIQLVCSKYVFRCQTVDNSTVDEITATFRKLPSRLQSYSSICDLVCDLVRSAGLDGVEVATRPMHPYPPWLLERAHVEVDMEGLMKDQNPLVLAVTARLCLEEKYQHHLKIFTDGSVMEDVAAGAAFVIPEFNNLTHSYIPWPVPRVTCPDWKGITTRQSSVRSRRRTRLYTDKAIYIRHNVLFSNEPIITGPSNGYTGGVRVRVQGQLDFMIVNCYTPQPCTSFDWLTELGGKGHWRLQRPGQQLGAGLRVLITHTHRPNRQQ